MSAVQTTRVHLSGTRFTVVSHSGPMATVNITTRLTDGALTAVRPARTPPLTAAPLSTVNPVIAPPPDPDVVERTTTPPGAVHPTSPDAFAAQCVSTQLPADAATSGAVCRVPDAASTATALSTTTLAPCDARYADNVRSAFAIDDNTTDTDDPASAAVAVRDHNTPCTLLCDTDSNRDHPAGPDTDGDDEFTATCNTNVSPTCTPAGTLTRCVTAFALLDADPTNPSSAAGGSGSSPGSVPPDSSPTATVNITTRLTDGALTAVRPARTPPLTAAPLSTVNPVIAPPPDPDVVERTTTPPGAVHPTSPDAFAAQCVSTQLPADAATSGAVCRVPDAASTATALSTTTLAPCDARYADNVRSAFAIDDNTTDTDDPASAAVAVRDHNTPCTLLCDTDSNRDHPAGPDTDGDDEFTATCNTNVSPTCTPAGTLTRCVTAFALLDADPTNPSSAAGGSGSSVGSAPRVVDPLAPAPSVTVNSTVTGPGAAYRCWVCTPDPVFPSPKSQA